MIKENKGSIAIRIFAIVISIVFIITGSRIFNVEEGESVDVDVYKAEVVEIISQEVENIGNIDQQEIITFTALMNDGDEKGKEIIAIQSMVEAVGYRQNPVEVGDNVLLSNTSPFEEGGETAWYFLSHNKANNMVVLIGIFIALVLLISGRKGIGTVMSLAITVGVIFFVYIPAVLAGTNVYLATSIIAVFIILSSLIILNGANKKTFCAIVGNIGGILGAGVVAFIANISFDITGVVDEQYMHLKLMEGGAELDLIAIVWGGIIIGALGAIMDVAMSIASSMNELSEEMKEKTFGKLVKSGFNIGKDAIGTMTNTLILAYVGSALAMLLLFSAYNRDFYLVLNYESIIVEVIQSIVGSIGILLAVPITVIFSGWMFNKK